MPITNDEIYAYLVDLSANIAQQFAQVNNELIVQQVTLNAVTGQLGGLIISVNQDFASVNDSLDALNTELIVQQVTLNAVTGQLGGVSKQVSNVQGYLESEINTGLIEITKQVGDVQGYLESEINAGILLNTAQLSSVIIQGNVIQNQITQETNDINTHTNVALSAAVNAINTNTNAAVGDARDNINAHINPLLLNNIVQK